MTDPLASTETPYERVRRRRAEGATDAVLREELLARGLDTADVSLLLGQAVAPQRLEVEATAAAEGTPWALVQKRLAEGFPREAIEAELAALGHSKEDIRALLVDEALRPTSPEGAAGPDAGAGVPVNVLFGGLLALAGVLLLLGGRISVLSLGLVVSGLGRMATAFRTERGAAQQQREAQRGMQALASDDPRPRCAHHAQYASVGTCPRCGSFSCAKCTPRGGFTDGAVCMRCQALPEVVALRERKAARQAALFLLSAPATILVVVTLDALGSSDGAGPAAVALVTGVVSLPWLVLAGVQAVVRRPWPTIVSLAPWLALLVFVLISTDGRAVLQLGLWLVPLGFALAGWLSLRQAGKPQPALVADVQPTASAG